MTQKIETKIDTKTIAIDAEATAEAEATIRKKEGAVVAVAVVQSLRRKVRMIWCKVSEAGQAVVAAVGHRVPDIINSNINYLWQLFNKY